VSENVASTSNTIMLTNTGLQLAMSGSLAALWAMLNALQLQVNMMLIRIEWPANVLMLFTSLMNIASFNVIPTGEATAQMFNFTATDAYTDGFNEMGLTD